MPTVILSINTGSSSLKTALYAVDDESQSRSPRWLASAEISAIGENPKFKYKQPSSSKDADELDQIDDHEAAFAHVLKSFLGDAKVPEVASKDDIHYACHRVVQGGDLKDQLITRETLEKVEKLSDLAPLHNAAAIRLVKACREQLPTVTNVAFFDSGFHATMPEYVKTYAINQKIAKEKNLRKYGFHGLSYSYVLRRTARFLHKETAATSLIVLHLGSGASACAIEHGKSVDTTMGLTPVCGLPGSSRSGDIDPSLVFHYTSKASDLSSASTKNLHISTAEEILNKQSGWKALTGTSDFSKIADPSAPDTHKLALNIFVDRIVGFIGNYYVKLGGQVDALVFAGGIGEKSPYMRQLVSEKIACLGFTLDHDKNLQASDGGDVVDIGTSEKIWTLVCGTDEAYEMASNMMQHLK